MKFLYSCCQIIPTSDSSFLKFLLIVFSHSSCNCLCSWYGGWLSIIFLMFLVHYIRGHSILIKSFISGSSTLFRFIAWGFVYFVDCDSHDSFIFRAYVVLFWSTWLTWWCWGMCCSSQCCLKVEKGYSKMSVLSFSQWMRADTSRLSQYLWAGMGDSQASGKWASQTRLSLLCRFHIMSTAKQEYQALQGRRMLPQAPCFWYSSQSIPLT